MSSVCVGFSLFLAMCRNQVLQDKRKAWGPVPVARSTLGGSGIAHRSRTSNIAETSRRYVHIIGKCRYIDRHRIWTYPLRHLPVASDLTTTVKFTRFPSVKNERRVNAFPLCMTPQGRQPPTPPLTPDRVSAVRSVSAKL